MSVENGYIRHKKHIKQENGTYKPVSYWTSSNSVEMNSGNTLQEEMDLIDIQKSYDGTCPGSIDGGGLKLEMTGKTEQKTLSGKNLCDFGTKEVTNSNVGYQTFKLNSPIPPGTYTLSANVTSTDTDATTCVFALSNDADVVETVGINRNERSASTFTIEQEVTKIIFYSGNSASNSPGDTSVWKDIQIEAGEVATDYEPYCGGTPSPNQAYPQVIENVGDCVEMIQGDHDTKGIFRPTKTDYITTKHKIPCKAGDVVNVNLEKTNGVYISNYNGDAFVVQSGKTNTTNTSFTIPDGVTHFYIDIGTDGKAITPQTVGKITLTVNGKHVVQIVEHGKNWLNITNKSFTACGVATTIKDGVVTVNGKATESGGRTNYLAVCTLPKGTYCMSHNDYTGVIAQDICISNANIGSVIRIGIGTFTLVEETRVGLGLSFVNGNSYNGSCMFQIEEGTATPYEPYTEKVATIFLDEPLREKDSIKRKDEVIGENRKKGILDLGTLDWDYDDTYHIFNAKTPKVKTSGSLRGRKCYCTHYTDINTTNISNWSGLGSVDNIISCGCSYHFGTQSTSAIVITNFDYTDATEFKNAMSGVMVEYDLIEETFTPLDAQSQIALNGLETFKDMTYLEVDSKIKPSGIEVEYGTSKVSGIALKNELRHDTQDIIIAEQNAKIEELTTALLMLNQE